DGKVVIARATMSVAFPARFTLVGASNPCPCGRLGDPTGKCICSPSEVERYASRMSGPLSDRIDMHVAVGAVPLGDLSSSENAEPSSAIRDRVARARVRQNARFVRLRGVQCNAHAPGRWIDSHGYVEPSARGLLQKAAGSLSLSARGYHRVLKVARTIADIDQDDAVTERHVAEALRYRPGGK
ncbi:MAG TPA: ATP-binding protein, partial [Gemmatimonadaceae bacterium]|nr:ATP-binding protein [Gemmatimonadaceae bacterium]